MVNPSTLLYSVRYLVILHQLDSVFKVHSHIHKYGLKVFSYISKYIVNVFVSISFQVRLVHLAVYLTDEGFRLSRYAVEPNPFPWRFPHYSFWSLRITLRTCDTILSLTSATFMLPSWSFSRSSFRLRMCFVARPETIASACTSSSISSSGIFTSMRRLVTYGASSRD